MTATLGSAATAKVLERITGQDGMNAALAALTTPGNTLPATIGPSQIRAQNVAADLTDRTSPALFPSVNIYCEKIVNDLTEKFRSFSGSVQMAIDVRHSQDKLEGLQGALELYADSLIHTLDATRGDWEDGMFYAGGYEVSLGAVKHGGKNFVQAAKITFRIGVSRS